MTEPKFTTKLPNDMGRGYIHPETGETLIGVSTLERWAVAKPQIGDWRADQVAKAGAEVGLLATSRGDPLPDEVCGFFQDWDADGLQEWLREAPNRITKGAADDGDMVHDWFAAFALDRSVPLPEEIPERWSSADLGRVRQMCVHLRDLIEFWQIEILASELTVFSSALGIAGTLDIIMDSPLLPGGPFIGDLKTTNGAKPRSSVTFQLPCYALADGCWDEEGAVREATPVSLDHGYVIKVKADGAKLFRIDYFNEKYSIDMFAEIRNAVEHFRWAEHGSKLVSDALTHPHLNRGEVVRRIHAATSRDELVATWKWATIEGLWEETLLEEIQNQQEKLKGN